MMMNETAAPDQARNIMGLSLMSLLYFAKFLP